jgi:hypothetical protein
MFKIEMSIYYTLLAICVQMSISERLYNEQSDTQKHVQSSAYNQTMGSHRKFSEIGINKRPIHAHTETK